MTASTATSVSPFLLHRDDSVALTWTSIGHPKSHQPRERERERESSRSRDCHTSEYKLTRIRIYREGIALWSKLNLF